MTFTVSRLFDMYIVYVLVKKKLFFVFYNLRAI